MVDLIDEVTFEQMLKNKFGVRLNIDKFVLTETDVSRNSKATVFLTDKKQLYCYISGIQNLSLGDIQKIVRRMGLVPELYLPPKGQPTYFDDIGKDKFQEVFPGRKHISSDDISFYRTLAPYNPALIIVKEVKNGEIHRYDPDARTGWRLATKLMYRRIRTS